MSDFGSSSIHTSIGALFDGNAVALMSVHDVTFRSPTHGSCLFRIYGITCCQVVWYFKTYPLDQVWLKSLVSHVHWKVLIP